MAQPTSGLLPGTNPPTFEGTVLALHTFWQSQGCILWHPYHEMVGAGTGNPATALRVLGPEPWSVAYVEPSFRPDDGRFAESPNRLQMHHQYQVILKPAPAAVQDTYLASLESLGLKLVDHDIRFVEDNWESPALGAWGLGWEVWLDGLEITQFTYFQQAAGERLDPPAVEITYGLERIALFLQGVRSIFDLRWNEKITYGQLLQQQEVEFCRYYFNDSDPQLIRSMLDLAREEADQCIAKGLVMPAHDAVLKCSHLFNVLDARGVIGLSDRVKYFAEFRDRSRKIAQLYLAQRRDSGFPLSALAAGGAKPQPVTASPSSHTEPSTFLLELGFEELASREVANLQTQFAERLPRLLSEARLNFGQCRFGATPRRIVAIVDEVAARADDVVREIWGPKAEVCSGNKAALVGFCRRVGVDPSSVQFRADERGVQCAFVVKQESGRSAGEVLAEVAKQLIASLRCESSMRWLCSETYSDEAKSSLNRPLRWIVALCGNEVVRFRAYGVESGRKTRLGRWLHQRDTSELEHASDYESLMATSGIELDRSRRRDAVLSSIDEIARRRNLQVQSHGNVVEEIIDLVESPHAIECCFDEEFLSLPQVVRRVVLEKHIRCLTFANADGTPSNLFVAIINGVPRNIATVRAGFELIAKSRLADARFFFSRDLQRPFDSFVEPLGTLLFHTELGSMRAKAQRLVRLAEEVARLARCEVDLALLRRAAALSKHDLATQMVVEMTSLAGHMGEIYARAAGEAEEVAVALREQYLPATSGDVLPKSLIGALLGVADRSDTLAGLFSLGLEPTGSADPYALRREASTLVTLITGLALDIDLRELFSAALVPFSLAPKLDRESLLQTMLGFVQKRYEVSLRDAGHRHDVVAAVLEPLASRPHRVAVGIKELEELLSAAAHDEAVARGFVAHARMAKLYEAVVAKGEQFAEEVDASLFVTTEERSLLARVEGMRGVPQSLGPAFRTLVGMAPDIDAFLDKVHVLTDDQRVRANRLALVRDVAGLLNRYVSILKLERFSLP